MEEETTDHKTIGLLYARPYKNTFRVAFLVIPTLTGSFNEIMVGVQSTYLELEDCVPIGIAQRTTGDLQLCNESAAIFLHFASAIGMEPVSLVCKTNGGILEHTEKWAALYSTVNGQPQQVAISWITRRSQTEDDSFKILTAGKTTNLL